MLDTDSYVSVVPSTIANKTCVYARTGLDRPTALSSLSNQPPGFVDLKKSVETATWGSLECSKALPTATCIVEIVDGSETCQSACETINILPTTMLASTMGYIFPYTRRMASPNVAAYVRSLTSAYCVCMGVSPLPVATELDYQSIADYFLTGRMGKPSPQTDLLTHHSALTSSNRITYARRLQERAAMGKGLLARVSQSSCSARPAFELTRAPPWFAP